MNKELLKATIDAQQLNIIDNNPVDEEQVDGQFTHGARSEETYGRDLINKPNSKRKGWKRIIYVDYSNSAPPELPPDRGL